MLRFLLWRLLWLLAIFAGVAAIAWLLNDGPGRVLRDHGSGDELKLSLAVLVSGFEGGTHAVWSLRGVLAGPRARVLAALVLMLALAVTLVRLRARRARRYVRLTVDAYRADHADPQALAMIFAALHKRLLRRWWRRVLLGQPSLSLEIHHTGGTQAAVWLALTCLQGQERAMESALQGAYPNCRLRPAERQPGAPPAVLRLKKHALFIQRIRTLEERARRSEPSVDRLLTAMGACAEPAFVQLVLTPTPALFEAFARHLFRHHEARLARERREHLVMRDRSMVEDAELRGGLEI
ncbi:MAG TPA: hypothetical protein VED41_07845, partial [Solirubrobacteraceae bacterium]|nr:hypothetical protein [Solirubrobacteraceae bacterium]